MTARRKKRSKAFNAPFQADGAPPLLFLLALRCGRIRVEVPPGRGAQTWRNGRTNPESDAFSLTFPVRNDTTEPRGGKLGFGKEALAE